ncbi:bicaudal-D-related protein 2-like [Lampris incognitus]|uniref:bicaudal-D-related protein 2-like n=1 Tax=Lampris incognitus TaxID=2546036 RepID=UPI0024B5C26F|nr:bicaudal-D-related protein 2-like [Lampris incognitus]
MDDSVPFSVLNERMKPHFTAMDRLCSSLNTLQDRQRGSLRSTSSTVQPTVLPPTSEPEPDPESLDCGTTVDPEEPGDKQERADSNSDGLLSLTVEEEDVADQVSIDNLVPILTLEDMNLFGHEELAVVLESIVPSPSEEEGDAPGGPTPAGTQDTSEAQTLNKDSGSPSQRNYVDTTLPDLIRSGRPLGRRRTLGPVSDTLKEVRREVELSRRRSLKLKAQVDKLQESRDGPGWSKHRERVTEEVLSILRLLYPLTEPKSSPAEPTGQENCLDAALNQLQGVARKLAISHTKQACKSGAAKENGREDSAILQQALRDRDEAIEKKKAMEAELLRSKTEMMTLNNQLLEAVQKRLELSLELEAWKEDVQLILNQQLLSQQQAEQAEQAQRKPSRLGLMRRTNRAPIQRPISFSLPATPSNGSNHVFPPRSLSSSNSTCPRATAAPAPSIPPASPQRTWRDRLRRGKNRAGDQDASGQELQASVRGTDDGFQVVSLD